MQSYLSILLLFGSLFPSAQATRAQRSIDVLFSPGGGCTRRIIEEIASARTMVRIQAFSLTSAPITGAVLGARRRGVWCEVILDKSQEAAMVSEAKSLSDQGVPVLIDDQHGAAHNKVILIDDHTIITGSFNFTGDAEAANAENLLVIKNYRDLFRRYEENYGKHRRHSRPYRSGLDAELLPGSPRPETGQTEPSRDEVTVYVTRTGSKYHRAACRSLRKSSLPMSLKDAAARYGPCARCRPPK